MPFATPTLTPLFELTVVSPSAPSASWRTLPTLRWLRDFVRSDADIAIWPGSKWPQKPITRPAAQRVITDGINRYITEYAPQLHSWNATAVSRGYRSRNRQDAFMAIHCYHSHIWGYRRLAHIGNRHNRRRYQNRLADYLRQEPNRAVELLCDYDGSAKCHICQRIIAIANR